MGPQGLAGRGTRRRALDGNDLNVEARSSAGSSGSAEFSYPSGSRRGLTALAGATVYAQGLVGSPLLFTNLEPLSLVDF